MIAVKVTGFTDVEKKKKIYFIVIGISLTDCLNKALTYKYLKSSLKRVKYISNLEVIGDEELSTFCK
jgi:hypothetical protein